MRKRIIYGILVVLLMVTLYTLFNPIQQEVKVNNIEIIFTKKVRDDSILHTNIIDNDGNVVEKEIEFILKNDSVFKLIQNNDRYEVDWIFSQDKRKIIDVRLFRK